MWKQKGEWSILKANIPGRLMHELPLYVLISKLQSSLWDALTQMLKHHSTKPQTKNCTDSPLYSILQGRLRLAGRCGTQGTTIKWSGVTHQCCTIIVKPLWVLPSVPNMLQSRGTGVHRLTNGKTVLWRFLIEMV